MNDLFQQQSDLPQIDENKNYLEELVGPGKKFATVEEMAKGKFYADQLIEIKNQREDEMRKDMLQLRSENIAKAKLEELIDRLQTQNSNSDTTPPQVDNPPVYDPSKIAEIVSEKIRENETLQKQSANATLVRSKLKEQFGSNFQNVLKERTEALGLTESFVNDLAKNHPTVLFKTLGMDQQQTTDVFQTPPRSAQRSDSFAPKGAPERTWSYYQDLKRKDPGAWLDRKTAIQMQEDAIRLGERFRDGDYFVKGLHET